MSQDDIELRTVTAIKVNPTFRHQLKHTETVDVETERLLQFQKHLRLQEAPRLMLREDLDAAEAGYRVGDDDASHCSREYKRHFGEPPMRDVERMREVVTGVIHLI